MGSPTRYKNGVTNVGGNDPMKMLQIPDPTLMHVYYNDFDTFTAADWTITTVEAGAGSATEALTDADGGVLLITNDAADNDSDEFQKVGESFLLTAGKKTMFKSRFKVSDATQSDLLMGLAVTDTTLLGATAGDGVTDGIFFQKDDGSTTLTCYCQKNTTTGQTSGNAHTMVSDTYIVAAWYYDGINKLEYFIDGIHKGTLDASSTYLPDTELTVSFAIMNGEAAAKTMSIDYILVAQER